MASSVRTTVTGPPDVGVIPPTRAWRSETRPRPTRRGSAPIQRRRRFALGRPAHPGGGAAICVTAVSGRSSPGPPAWGFPDQSDGDGLGSTPRSRPTSGGSVPMAFVLAADRERSAHLRGSDLTGRTRPTCRAPTLTTVGLTRGGLDVLNERGPPPRCVGHTAAVPIRGRGGGRARVIPTKVGRGSSRAGLLVCETASPAASGRRGPAPCVVPGDDPRTRIGRDRPVRQPDLRPWRTPSRRRLLRPVGSSR
jgi:hypothetical protein